jgi:hemoglobin
MYAFWDSVLFGVPGFKGNPLAVHLVLAGRTPLTSHEFDRWVSVFHATVDELFVGPMATEAKQRAVRIATMMQYHIAAAAAASR